MEKAVERMRHEFFSQPDDAWEVKNAIRKPKMYKVVMHNDDYTTMDFVVDVLIRIFHKDKLDAINTMIAVHNSGKGVAGVYPYDIAATKKLQTDQLAGQNGFPLRLTLDEAIE